MLPDGDMGDPFTKSRSLFGKAQEFISGGVNSGIRLLEKPVPLYFSHGSGSRLWDVDGNEYIDYQLGQGALLYGHAPPRYAKALSEQAGKGVHWAAQCELEIKVAERLCGFYPSIEQVRFNNSATEVVQAALRLARAVTGKKYIIRFEGHYHGWMDEGLIGFANPEGSWGPDSNPARIHPSEGVIPEVLDYHVVTQWNNSAQFKERISAFSGEIAGVIFEPINCNTSCIEPVEGFLDTVRDLCDREGALMIADECITGSRFGKGGCQEFLGFIPDLTILGKALGGGLPFAALGGRKAYMDAITTGRVVHAGTLNGNPLCLAGSDWCLEQLEGLGSIHPQALNKLGQRLMNGLQELADEYNIPLVPQGPGAAFHCGVLKPGVEGGPIMNYRDYTRRHDSIRWAHLRRCLLEDGVRAIERGIWFMSLAHSEKDIEETLVRSRRAFARHAGSWKD